MSYRTYVNDVQVFGNDEYYSEWIEFIKAQGIDVNEEGYVDLDARTAVIEHTKELLNCSEKFEIL